MTRRRRLVAAGVLAAIGVAGGGYGIYRATRPDPPPLLPAASARAAALDAIPSGALFLLTIDLRALRASPLGGALAGPARSTWLGDVKGTCGFEPLDALTELAVVVPVNGRDGDLGIIGAGDVDAEAISACATKVIEARGGKPARTKLGSFTSVRDVGEGSHGSGEIAVKPGGPLLVGAGDFMRSLVDAADGAVPSIRSDQAHAALRLAVGDDALARFSSVLSAQQRATIADEVDKSGGRAPAVLKAALAAGLGLKVTAETVQLHAVVLLTGESEAVEFRKAVDELRAARAEHPLLRALGVSSLLERLQLSVDGKSVHVTLAMTIVEATQLLDRLFVLTSPAPKPPPTVENVPAPSATASASPSGSASARPSASAGVSASPRSSAAPMVRP